MEKMGLHRKDAEENVRSYLIRSYWDELNTIFNNIQELSTKGIETAPLYELMGLEHNYDLNWRDMEKIVYLLHKQWNYSYHVDGNCVAKVSWGLTE